MAFAVDEVLREEEVLVKPLGKPLVRVRNIAGATVLATGAVVPILNVTDLMKSARTRGSPPAQAPVVSEGGAPSKQILVVEDSITFAHAAEGDSGIGRLPGGRWRWTGWRRSRCYAREPV